jgi:hypothetical protein
MTTHLGHGKDRAYYGPERIIWYNAVKCRGCGQVVRSTFGHDFRGHVCQEDHRIAFWVDGGGGYLRRMWDTVRWPDSAPEDHYEELGHEIVVPPVAMGVPT